MKHNKKMLKKQAKQKVAKKTRKEQRKEQRKGKKLKKNDFFSRKKDVPGPGKFVSIKDNNNEKFTKTASLPVHNQKETMPQKNIEQLKLEREQKAALKKEKLEKEMHRVRVKQLRLANHVEDKLIKKLEKNLKLNKRKSKSVPKSFVTDGLDYLLEVCDQDKLSQFAEAEHNLHESGSEFEEDFAEATGKQRTSRRPQADAEGESGGDSESDSGPYGADFSDDDDESDDITSGVGDKVAAVLNKVFKPKGRAKLIADSRKAKRKLSESQCSDEDMNVEGTTGNKKQKTVRFAKNLVSYAEESDSSDGPTQSSISSTVVDKIKKIKDKLKKKAVGIFPLITDSNLESIDKKPKILTDKNKKIKGKRNKAISVPDNNLELVDKNDKKGKVKSILKDPVEDEVFEEGSDIGSFDELTNDDLDSDDLGSDCENSDGGAKDEKEDKVWEDIYGRTRDKAGNVVPTTKYIPPHLRAKTASTDKALQRLRAQLKGLLNRLAENNMKSIADQVEGFYMTNSRYDTSQSLTELMMESLVAPTLTPDRLVAEHAMLVAILHANVGTEVGAHFLQALVNRFDELFASNPPVQDKHLDNVLLVLSHLYNFKVFDSVLAYGILERLAENFVEKAVELILLVLKTAGPSLRRADPLALKELIVRLQSKAGSAGQLGDGTRVKFLMEVVLAIKNNNMNKIPSYDPEHSEHLKKLIKSFLRPGNYVTELKISLQDLLKADERGRWWVVGSAWSGAAPQPLPGGGTKPATQNFSAQLLALAKKQRMNTDVRRNIFCILMSAEDYLDAFEKLLHLGLKGQQEREIIHVLLDCCLQEKQSNPYYAHLACKFCEFDRKYQMALQFSVWDKLKEVGNMSSVHVTNLAKLLSHMFIEGGLPLSVLKVIHFAEVDKPTVRLVRRALLGVLLAESEDACCAAFARVARAEKLRLFREGLRLFLHHFVLRNTKSLPEGDVLRLQQRVQLADKALTVSESTTLF